MPRGCRRFHVTRVFQVLVGETLAEFANRLRRDGPSSCWPRRKPAGEKPRSASMVIDVAGFVLQLGDVDWPFPFAADIDDRHVRPGEWSPRWAGLP